jgi:hypothetical protein
MKTIYFSLITLIISFYVNIESFSQNTGGEKEGALFIKGGFSPLMGFYGCEYFNHKVSLQAGFGKLTAPISQETETTIGLGITFYDKSWYKSSPYVAIGFSVDGVVAEKGRTIYDTYDNDWQNLYSILAGYRVNISELFDIKAGVGYEWSKYTKGFSFEANVGFKLFSHKTKE